MRGIQWSMLMAAVFIITAGTIGVLYGAVAGYFGGRIDDALMRLLDVTFTLPLLAVVIVVAAAVPSARSPFGVALLIALLNWMALSRIVRVHIRWCREPRR